MPRRLEADDEVFRFRAVFLGPAPYTLLWEATYVAYGLGFAIFAIFLLIEVCTPLPEVSVMAWNIALTILATNLIMIAIDHDRPVASLARNIVGVLRAPRPQPTATFHVTPRLGRTVKTTKEPL